ncbi:MAG: dephospho-CoA kinase [Candidatus Azotimanducaceae bacterium]|jgi:dephospho-CoA kinase
MGRFVVGLTGGIGSGKSAVSARFEAFGITVADADVAARQVVEPGTEAISAIAARFGPDILQIDGNLNRASLRAIVFAEPDQRRWLESITIPAIMKRLKTMLEQSSSAYSILVLSSGNGQHPLIDRHLIVDVSSETQRRRVITRDNNTLTQVDAIMASQPSRQARLAYAQDVIINEGNITALDGQVFALHQKYTQLSGTTHGPT